MITLFLLSLTTAQSGTPAGNNHASPIPQEAATSRVQSPGIAARKIETSKPLKVSVGTGLKRNAAPDVRKETAEANTAFKKGDLQGARKSLLSALAKHPTHLDTLKALAALAMHVEDFDGAQQHLSKVLELDPFDDDSRLALGQAQWRAGHKQEALGTTSQLLERHPESTKGLALMRRIKGGHPAKKQVWSPIVRGEIGLGFDSNVALTPENGLTVLPELSEMDSINGTLGVIVGTNYRHPSHPLRLLGNISTQSSFDDRDQVEEFMPSVVGMSGTGRWISGPWITTLDLRYQELFVDSFAEHRQRSFSPSISQSWQLHSQHRLRLLVGVDVRQPFGSVLLDTNTTPKITLRDTFHQGKLTVMGEVGYRQNFDSSNPDLERDFKEVQARVYALYRVLDPLTLFAFAQVEGRDLDNRRAVEGTDKDAEGNLLVDLGPKETTWRTQVGARYNGGQLGNSRGIRLQQEPLLS